MSKNLVICCDGTSNGPTQARTNVLKLWLAIERGPHQIAYYDPGVGTLGNPHMLTTIGRRVSRAIDMATGKGIRENVMEAYEFLMEFFEEGDAIFLFGFSRGAYTVRALAGLLDMYGLLPRGGRNFVPYLWQMYSNDEQERTSFGRRMRIATELRRLNRQPAIRLVGVWDTVSSWGWFFNFGSLPMTRKFKRVEHIRHAVAIDERRAAFRQNLFDPKGNLDVQEVWFPGTHCDVGGGHPEEESGLSKLALKWMIDEAESFGLRLDAERTAKMLGGANKPGRTQYAAPDGCAKFHESLRGAWTVLEFVPRPAWHPTLERRVWKWNRGRRRYFPDCGSGVHISVGERSRKMDYHPARIVPAPQQER